jgi:quercetin dioxygenase-like cupin family protein
MEYKNDRDVKFNRGISGSKYLFVQENRYTFGTSYLNPGDEIKDHAHADEIELFYFISGAPKFIIAGKEFRVKSGDAFKALAGENHYLVNDTKEIVHMNFIKIKEAV